MRSSRTSRFLLGLLLPALLGLPAFGNSSTLGEMRASAEPSITEAQSSQQGHQIQISVIDARTGTKVEHARVRAHFTGCEEQAFPRPSFFTNQPGLYSAPVLAIGAGTATVSAEEILESCAGLELTVEATGFVDQTLELKLHPGTMQREVALNPDPLARHFSGQAAQQTAVLARQPFEVFRSPLESEPAEAVQLWRGRTDDQGHWWFYYAPVKEEVQAESEGMLGQEPQLLVLFKSSRMPTTFAGPATAAEFSEGVSWTLPNWTQHSALCVGFDQRTPYQSNVWLHLGKARIALVNQRLRAEPLEDGTHRSSLTIPLEVQAPIDLAIGLANPWMREERWSQTLTFTGQPPRELLFELPATHSLSGRVTGLPKRDLLRLELRAFRTDQPANQTADGEPFPNLIGTLSSEGSYSLYGLPAGSYRLLVCPFRNDPIREPSAEVLLDVEADRQDLNFEFSEK